MDFLVFDGLYWRLAHCEECYIGLSLRSLFSSISILYYFIIALCCRPNKILTFIQLSLFCLVHNHFKLLLLSTIILEMTTQLRIGKALQKQLLKCVVQYISSRSEWVKWISQLAKATTLVVNGSRSKQKKQKCLKCTKLFDNYLLLVLHLQLSHQDLLQIGRYEFDKQTLTLTISQKSAHKTSFFYCKTQSHEFQLLYSIQTRRERILQSLCAKFSKKQTIEPNQQTKYFHPVNVFRHLGQMEEDQEDPYGNIEEELQRIKISEFTDVNQNDKQFFIKWNQAVRKAKKEHVYLTENVMSALLESFAVEAGRSGLKRSNLLMHGFTLWSSGKISSSDVIMFLNAYDKNNNTT